MDSLPARKIWGYLVVRVTSFHSTLKIRVSSRLIIRRGESGTFNLAVPNSPLRFQESPLDLRTKDRSLSGQLAAHLISRCLFPRHSLRRARLPLSALPLRQ